MSQLLSDKSRYVSEELKVSFRLLGLRTSRPEHLRSSNSIRGNTEKNSQTPLRQFRSISLQVDLPGRPVSHSIYGSSSIIREVERNLLFVDSAEVHRFDFTCTPIVFKIIENLWFEGLIWWLDHYSEIKRFKTWHQCGRFGGRRRSELFDKERDLRFKSHSGYCKRSSHKVACRLSVYQCLKCQDALHWISSKQGRAQRWIWRISTGIVVMLLFRRSLTKETTNGPTLKEIPMLAPSAPSLASVSTTKSNLHDVAWIKGFIWRR